MEQWLNIPNATYTSPLRKGIYVLNIIIKNILEKKEMNKRDPKGTPKNLMPPTKVHKLDGSKNLDGGDNLKCNPKGEQIRHL